ncbi:MAG: CBS domain-containing protein [Dehalococcoidia bacterium]|nr:CBS domain-containing protein [Dehalococcoidia bacterium]
MYGHIGAVLADKGRQVYVISPAATVQEAVRLMNERGVGALLVMDRDRLAGIFTERDVLRRIVGAGQSAAAARVSGVMTATVATIDTQTRVQDAMELMTNERFRHLPVLEDGKVVGIISIGDLLRWVSMHQKEQIERMAEYIKGAATP